MSKLVILLLILVALAPGGVSSVFAQQPEKARLTGAAVLSVHSAGKSDCPYLCNPFGGNAAGVIAGVQFPASPTFRVGFEAGFERSIQGHQSERISLFGTARLLTSHRDPTISGVIVWAPHPEERIAQALVVGGTLAFRHTVRHTTAVFSGTNLPPPSSGRRDVVLDDQTFGLMGGVDFPVRISSRLFLIPTVRVHYLIDQDRRGGGVVTRGVGPMITRIGLGIGVGL